MNLFQKKHDWILGGFEFLRADDVIANAGSGGATFRTDQLGTGQHVPFTKLMSGTLDDTAVIPGDATNGLFVQVKASALPTGAATETTLAAASAKLPATLGQKAMTASMAVALASDQSALPITDNSGSLTTDTPQLPSTIGQKAAAASLSVVLASDQPVVPISDNSGSLTMDSGQLPATLGQKAMAASLAVAIASDQGAVPVSGTVTVTPSGTQTVAGAKTNNNAAPGATNIGTLPAVANAAAPTQTEGNQVALRATLSGDLAITLDGETVTLAADQTVNLNKIAGTATDTNSGNKSAGTLRVVLATDQPALTTAMPVSLATVPSHAVTNAGTFATQDSEKVADNAAFTDGTTKLMPAGFIFDETAGTALTENDIAAPRVDSKRAVVIAVEDATTRGQRQAVNTGGAAEVHGDAAHGASVAGNPVLQGMRAGTADFTAVADAQAVSALASILGKQVTMPYALPANFWNYAAPAGGLVNTTGVTAKAAAGAGIRNYVTKAQITNSHQTIGSEVVIRDGAAGTVLWRGWAQFTGGGIECKFEPPLRGTANTLIEIAEITATATAGVLVNLQGYTAAE